MRFLIVFDIVALFLPSKCLSVRDIPNTTAGICRQVFNIINEGKNSQMKPSFLKKLNVRVNLLPSLLICLILVTFAFGFYYYIHYVWLYKHLSSHIKEQTLKSQRSIDDSIKSLTEGVLTFSQDDLLLDTILTLTKPADFSNLPPRKKVLALKAHELAKQEALTGLKHLTAKTAQSLRLQSLDILLDDNQTIISSSVNTSNFVDNMSGTAPLKVIFDNTSAYLILTTGIKSHDNQTIGFVRAVASITDIKSYLKLSPRYYQSEKLELIDSNAMILLNKDGVLNTGLRYNLSDLDGLTDQIHTRADVIFMIYPIKPLKLFVIYTVSAKEVVRDWMDVFYVYCGVIVVIMMLLFLQVVVNFPKFVSKPLAELTKSIKTATSNQIQIPQKLNHEWLALANAINKLLSEIATAKPDLSTRPEPVELSKAKPLDTATTTKETTVVPTEPTLDTQDNNQSKETISEEAHSSILFEDFFTALKQRAERINRKDSVAVIFDCPSTLASKTVLLDTDKALEALDIILNHSISDMQEGVVTVLASETETQELVIEVIDTSAGYDSEVVEAFNSDTDYTGLVDIAQAKKILQSIGANLKLSSTKSKGSSYSATFNLNNSKNI